VGVHFSRVKSLALTNAEFKGPSGRDIASDPRNFHDQGELNHELESRFLQHRAGTQCRKRGMENGKTRRQESAYNQT
jgi:hypothetical protein